MNNEHDLLHLNFLPGSRSQAASRVIRLRELSLLGIAIGMIFSTMLLIFAASLVFLNSRLDNLLAVFNERQQLQQAAQKDLSVGLVVEQKKYLNIIQSQIAERFVIDSVIVKIAEAIKTTPTIALSTLKSDVSRGSLRVTGQANTRDGFLTFVEALKEIPEVKEVIYPPGVVFAIEPIVFDVALQL